MTSFLQDLEDQLRAAAQARTSSQTAPSPDERPRPHARRRWLTRWARLAPVAVAVAVTLAVVVGALVLLGHRGGGAPAAPASRPPQGALKAILSHTPRKTLRQEIGYTAAANRTAMSSPVCRSQTPPRESVIHGAPDAGMISALGVLRGRATPADHLHPQDLPQDPTYAAYARRVLTAGGTTYYLVPIHDDPGAGVPSDRCFDLEKQALQRELPHIPAALRATTQALQTAVINLDRDLVGAGPVDEVCVVTVVHNGNGFSCGATATQIRHGVPPENDGGTLRGIVPDGVREVRLTVAARAGHTVTVAVHDNFYAVPVPGATTNVHPVSAVTWLAADGRVLKTVTTPSLATLAGACRNHPSACAPMQLSASSSSATTAKITPAP
jgi:hypothetical protein